MSRQQIIANLMSHFVNRCGRRSRHAQAGHLNPPEILECRTLLSATVGGFYTHSFELESGTLSLTLFGDTNASIGVDGNGKLLINGTVARGDVTIIMGLGTEGDLDASAIKSLIITGGDGNNCIDLSGVTVDDFPNLTEVRVFGGAGNDEIIGSEFGEMLNGNMGNDTISGGNGDDVLLGGGGDDSLSGGNGHDTLRGHSGNDAIFGEAEGEGTGAPVTEQETVLIIYSPFPPVIGFDVDEPPGNDVVFGGAGDDRIEGNAGDDRVSGGDGSDVIDGHMGNDSITGGQGDDLIRGWQDKRYAEWR
ncbi:MAG: Ca2+-binding RTX toxin-like protein [Planctomycetaceae bacterium]|jgi:Ca2+-binding RTX toxin-like protein